jgi:hypothetical protein
MAGDPSQRLRATQISSTGQRRAHSGVTHSYLVCVASALIPPDASGSGTCSALAWISGNSSPCYQDGFWVDDPVMDKAALLPLDDPLLTRFSAEVGRGAKRLIRARALELRA